MSMICRGFVILLALIWSNAVKSQGLEFNFQRGAGSAYIFENKDKDLDVAFDNTSIWMAQGKIDRGAKKFSPEFTYSRFKTRANGTQWQVNEPLDARIKNTTLYLGLERTFIQKVFQLGYSAGLGKTSEKINYRNLTPSSSLEDTTNEYLSVRGSFVAQFTVLNKIGVLVEPTFQWNNPGNAFGNKDDRSFANEDLNTFFPVGFSYTF